MKVFGVLLDWELIGFGFESICYGLMFYMVNCVFVVVMVCVVGSVILFDCEFDIWWLKFYLMIDVFCYLF